MDSVNTLAKLNIIEKKTQLKKTRPRVVFNIVLVTSDLSTLQVVVLIAINISTLENVRLKITQ